MKLHVQCMYNTLWCEQHETLKYRCIQWLRSGQPTKTIFDLALFTFFKTDGFIENWWRNLYCFLVVEISDVYQEESRRILKRSFSLSKWPTFSEIDTRRSLAGTKTQPTSLPNDLQPIWIYHVKIWNIEKNEQTWVRLKKWLLPPCIFSFISIIYFPWKWKQ